MAFLSFPCGWMGLSSASTYGMLRTHRFTRSMYIIRASAIDWSSIGAMVANPLARSSGRYEILSSVLFIFALEFLYGNILTAQTIWRIHPTLPRSWEYAVPLF